MAEILNLYGADHIPLFLWSENFGLGHGGTTETWSHFGAFFSGIVSPLLALLSLIGVLITIRTQGESNKQQAYSNQRAEDNRKHANELQIRVEEKRQENFEVSLQNENALCFKAQSNLVRTVGIEILNNSLDKSRIQVVKSARTLLSEMHNLKYDVPDRLSSYKIIQRDIIVRSLCAAVTNAEMAIEHLRRHGYDNNEINLISFDNTITHLRHVIKENGGMDD
ncbi:hypothetical protein CWC11_06295 [Pseudoalteromonas sp. S3178]|uniref:hypothetical protein n=1 Tax=Pseudoalteromonas sp. S3178 TaxID=579532 RepID=UPI00110B9F09|nr:hypothetical protein [Pseudoalteromonas sp. S3178]TMP07564.1 hypothetical protein CWC11_06295 [Pseudoalteromonas sp. S3178]